jgi:hypothetical protein
MARNVYQLMDDMKRIEANGFEVEYDSAYKWVHVSGLELPKSGIWTTENNERITHTSLLIDIPPDWPMHPPGVGPSHPGSAIHTPLLLYNRNEINDLHLCNHDPWYWLCFQKIYWKPEFGLIGLLQIIEQSIWGRVK